jgi:hypothetical protein
MIDFRVDDPCAIARAILDAVTEIEREGGSKRADVAVRVMVAQLAWACRAGRDKEDYEQLVKICQMRATSL